MYKNRKYNIITLYLVLCLIDKSCFAYKSEKCNNINQIVNRILNKSIFYQVAVLFRKQTCQTVIIDSMIENINHKNTVLTIGASNSGHFNKYKDSLRWLMLNPRHSTFIITVFSLHIKNSNDTVLSLTLFKNSIEYIVSLDFRRTRPLCLFILDVQGTYLTSSIKDMLNYAWYRRFLDITILQCYTNDIKESYNLTVNFYNPFTNVYYNSLYCSSADLFPNKLLNMHRYSLAVAIIRRPPALNFKTDPRSGKLLQINGSDYGTLIILAESLNFTINWTPFNVKSYSEPIVKNKDDTILDMILRGDVDFGGNQIYQHLALKDNQRQGERSIVTYIDEFTALVPIFPSPTWRIGYGTIVIMANVLVHVSLVYALAKILKFCQKCWLPHHILQVLLGIASPKLPLTIKEKGLFVFLIFLSLQYSSELYAMLTDLTLLETDDGPFYTYKDLIKSNLTIEMHPNHIKMTFQDNDHLLVGLEKRVKYVNDTMNCPERLLRTKSVACLMDQTIAYAKILWDSRLHRPSMKLLKPIWSAPKGCILSEASPYVLEFNRLMMQIHETGLWIKWIVHEKKEYLHTLPTRIERLVGCDRFLMKKLKIIYFTGCFLSIVAFISELLTTRVNTYLV